jgi:hypothetical protein
MTRRNRPVVIVAGALLVVSTAFPVAASLLTGPAPRWMGILDVVVAFALVCAGLFLALLVVFFLVGDSIKWSILLPGLAWRAWLVGWVLPAALAL